MQQEDMEMEWECGNGAEKKCASFYAQTVGVM
jgi:hypothetical protein